MGKPRGFALNSPAQQKYVSQKGGRVKTKKGLGAMPPEKARKIQSMGGKRKAQVIKERKLNEEDSISDRNGGGSIAEERHTVLPR